MAYLSVFLLGFLDIFLPLPVIVAMDGPVEPAFIVTGIAGSLSCFVFIYLSRPIRRWVVRRYGMQGLVVRRTEQFMAKYGAVGVGLLAPLILGQALTAIGAVILGAPANRLALWMIAGIWLWTAVYYVGLLMGVSLIVGDS